MAHEFRIHHLSSQLLQLLQLQHLDPDPYNDTFLAHTTPYVTTQITAHASLQRIMDNSSDGVELQKRYTELKVKQARELDPLVYLLSKLVDEPRLCEFLRQQRPVPVERKPVSATIQQIDIPEGVPPPILPPKGTKLSAQEVETVKGRLAAFTKGMTEADRRKKQQRSVPTGDFPKLPAWLSTRTYLTSDFVKPQLTQTSSQMSLGSLPPNLQQNALMDDLLHLMLGVNGHFVTAKPLKSGQHQREFQLDHTINTSLQSLVTRILPLCSHYSTVCSFVEEHCRYSHGTINQALCAAMMELVREHTILVAQLENQFLQAQLTLQKMWYYVQPCLRSMELLARIASTVDRGNCFGGRTLTILHEITVSLLGDEKSQSLCLLLTQAACQPFLKMLGLWIHHGQISDPYYEFMIQENKEIEKDRLHAEFNDRYWEYRYVIRRENIPVFLEHIAEKILHTGKYLNVVRGCGREVAFPDALELMYSLEERQYIEQIERAYAYASRQLVSVIMDEYDLMGCLHSIKHYFLLDHGDLFVHFLDLAEEELQKSMGNIPLNRLESLLEVAMRISTKKSDPYKDNVKVLLVPYNLKLHLRHIISIMPEQPELRVDPPPVSRPASSTKLPGYEAVSLDYEVKWPLSLVISRKNLTRYQLIFRHLFFCKYVERQMTAAWKRYNNTQIRSAATSSRK